MAETTDIVRTLAQAELFAGLDEGTLARVAQVSEVKQYGENDVLYEPGDEAADAFVLISGRVRFMLNSGGQSRSSGSVMSSRKVFGWAALVPEHPRRVATAVCLEPSEVIAVNGEKLLHILEENTAAGFMVMRRLTEVVARSFMDQN